MRADAAMPHVPVMELREQPEVQGVLVAVAAEAVTHSTESLTQPMAQQTQEAVAVAVHFVMAPTTPAAAVEAEL